MVPTATYSCFKATRSGRQAMLYIYLKHLCCGESSMKLSSIKRRNGFFLSALAPVLAVGAFALYPAPASAAATPAAAPLKVPNLKFEKYTLPNGLVVILREDHRLPLVAVDLWYH